LDTNKRTAYGLQPTAKGDKMSKTKMIVKDDQILVDLQWIFEEIRSANGDWKAVEEQLKGLLSAVEE
jgi:hypothetical protein